MYTFLNCNLSNFGSALLSVVIINSNQTDKNFDISVIYRLLYILCVKYTTALDFNGHTTKATILGVILSPVSQTTY